MQISCTKTGTKLNKDSASSPIFYGVYDWFIALLYQEKRWNSPEWKKNPAKTTFREPAVYLIKGQERK